MWWFTAIGLAVAIVGSVTGDFFVKQGSSEIKGEGIQSFGGVKKLFSPVGLFAFLRQLGIFHNWKLGLGILCLTFYFGGYIFAVGNAPVTLVAPFMATTDIINTFIGKFVLHERVSWLRWLGVIIVTTGVTILVGFSSSGEENSGQSQQSLVPQPQIEYIQPAIVPFSDEVFGVKNL